MKKNKKAIIIVVVIILVLIVVAAVAGGGKGDKMAVNLTEVTKLDITEYVNANGKIQSAVDVKISSEVSGEIIELAVKEGDMVKEGDLLLKINPDIYISSLNRARAAVNTAKANLANAKAGLAQVKAQFINSKRAFERNEKLYKSGAISQAEFENIESTYEVGKAQVDASKQSVVAAEFSVKSSEATLKEANDNLKRTAIFSPQAGTVSALTVEQGERVVGTAQMQGTAMMNVANMKKMEVHVDVNENDIIRVKIGDTALVEVDSYLGKKFKGEVIEIANAAASLGTGTDQVTNFAVKIALIDDGYEGLMEGKPAGFSPFRPGMSAAVEIITKSVKNIIAVPIESVTTRSDSTGKVNRRSTDADKEFECVFVKEGTKAIMRKVKTGIQDNKNIQITEGLEPGEEVISGPYSAISRTLKNNVSVEVAEEEELVVSESE
jgi:HlyD family secretion protein